MDQRERRDKQLPYISDEHVFEEQKRARKLTQQLNTMERSDFEGIERVVKELFGKSGIIASWLLMLPFIRQGIRFTLKHVTQGMNME